MNRYRVLLQPHGGDTEVWVRIHVAPTDGAARAWLEESGMRPEWDLPPPGVVAASFTSGYVSPPAIAPVR